jgi:hypothetical protein
MATLRERCAAILSKIQTDGMLRQHSPVETLMAFVMSEQGRAADKSLEETHSLFLYFPTKQDRDEFVALVREAKPGMVARPVP